jgi:ribosomal protein S27E
MSDAQSPDLILITCGKCGKKYRVPAAAAGKRVKCKACGDAIDVPSAAPKAAVPSAPAPTPPAPAPEPRPSAPAQPAAVPPQVRAPAEPEAPQPAAAPEAEAAASAGAIGAKKDFSEMFRRREAERKRKRIIIAILISGAVVLLVVLGFLIPGGPQSDDAEKMKALDAKKKEAEPLLKDLESKDAKTRSDAAYKLGDKKDWAPVAVKPLWKALETETDNNVRKEMESALRRLGAPIAEPK